MLIRRSFKSNLASPGNVITTPTVDDFSSPNLNELDPAAHQLMKLLFRVISVEEEIQKNGIRLIRTQLYNRKASFIANHESASKHPSVFPGLIVSPRWQSKPELVEGAIRLSRLSVYQCPIAGINIFDLIPTSQVKDVALIQRGFSLLQDLPEPLRFVFNAIFWDGDRFKRFCCGPSSMQGHHAEMNGNLRHTIETAEQVLSLCNSRHYMNRGIAVLAALLHDAGKADEYYQNAKGGWELTGRGKLLGHRVTVIEWIAAAVAKWNIQINEESYFSLLHALTAIPHAPEWMGIRTPATAESFVLSMADRLSGRDDLFLKHFSPDGGWGKYHRHLGFAPFTLGIES